MPKSLNSVIKSVRGVGLALACSAAALISACVGVVDPGDSADALGPDGSAGSANMVGGGSASGGSASDTAGTASTVAGNPGTSVAGSFGNVGGSPSGMGGTFSSASGPGNSGASSVGVGSTGSGIGGTSNGGSGNSGPGPAKGGSGNSGPSGGGTSNGVAGNAGRGGMSATGSGGTTAVVCTSNTTWRSGNGPTMRPGAACKSCHNFTVAGTVYPTAHEPTNCNGVNGSTGVRVVITGSNGTKVTLTPSAAGNFYTSTRISTPFTVELTNGTKTRTMIMPQTSGDCNSCHTQNGANGSPGRIMAP